MSLSGDFWQKRSPDVKNLIRSLIQRDVTQRLSAAEAIKHKWIERKVHHNEFDVEAARETLSNLHEFRVSQSNRE